MNTLKSILPAAALASLALGIAPTSAFAVTATATFAVSATVATACSVGASPMAFGSYSALVTSTSTSQITVTCTNTTPYTLGLGAGQGTVTARVMKSGGVALNYGLFTDAAWTVNFATLASTNGTGTSQNTTVYGQILSAQYVTPGAYTDNIVATVTY